MAAEEMCFKQVCLFVVVLIWFGFFLQRRVVGVFLWFGFFFNFIAQTLGQSVGGQVVPWVYTPHPATVRDSLEPPRQL